MPFPLSMPLGGMGRGYNISRSLRFNSAADNTYLTRTFGTPTAGNQWTISCWVKRSALGTVQRLISAWGGSTSERTFINFANASDQLEYVQVTGGAATIQITSTRVFRDVGAWGHLVISVDANSGTAANRFRAWYNGEAVAMSANPSSTTGLYMNKGTYLHTIGGENTTGTREGYLAEVHFLDGTAVSDATSFGQTDSTTGQWVPKRVTGVTYGTNGFYLSFANNTSTTTLGYDDAGGLAGSGAGSNDWTLNNFSVTAGVGNDSLTDTPTNNYCTLVRTDSGGPTTNIQNGGLQLASGTDGSVRSSFWIDPSDQTGYYFEIISPTLSTAGLTGGGVGSAEKFLTSGASWTTSGWDAAAIIKRGAGGSNNWNYYLATISGTGGAADQATGVTAATTDILQVAVKAGKVWLGINNTWVASGNPSAGTGQLLTFTKPVSPFLIATTDGTVHANFGQRAFSYTPPTGFKTLCTTNLAEPTIKKPNQYMDISLWTGNSSNPRTITTGVAFAPDLVWTKARNNGVSHAVQDAVRGFGVSTTLQTNTSSAEGASADGGVTSVAAGSLTLNAGGSGSANVNNSTVTYVAWQWKKGVTPGLDIVSFTSGASGTQTISHSLGVTPSLFLLKSRTSANAWIGWHKALSSATNSYFILDASAAATSSNIWPAINSTQVQATIGTALAASKDYIGYFWAEIPGFSKFGSYQGNASADGPFVHCGFRPKYVLVKSIAGALSWLVEDGVRTAYNPLDNELYPDLSNAEGSSVTNSRPIDLLSNGFKLRGTNSVANASASYFFAAFAEAPFKYANAR